MGTETTVYLNESISQVIFLEILNKVHEVSIPTSALFAASEFGFCISTMNGDSWNIEILFEKAIFDQFLSQKTKRDFVGNAAAEILEDVKVEFRCQKQNHEKYVYVKPIVNGNRNKKIIAQELCRRIEKLPF